MKKRCTKTIFTVCLAAMMLSGCSEIDENASIDVSAPITTESVTEAAAEAATEEAQENTSDEVVYFYQKDEAWASSSLGDSIYTMGDSGCVTCCVAAVLQMQHITIDGLASDADAGEVNQFFSENGGYDSEGNMLWDTLEERTGQTVVRKDASELGTSELYVLLDTLLEEGIYPILRVKVDGNGAYHYVVLVSSENGTYSCMDPLHSTEELVPLSDFGDAIYAIRYIQTSA